MRGGAQPDRHIEDMRKSMQVLLEDPAHKGNLYIVRTTPVIPCSPRRRRRARAAGAALKCRPGGVTARSGAGHPKIDAGPWRCSSCPCTTTWKSGRPPRPSCGERPVAGRARGRLRLVTAGQKRNGARKTRRTSTRGATPTRLHDRGAGRNRTRTGRRDAHLATLVRPDYWFSDEAKAFGLSDMFVPGGMGETRHHPRARGVLTRRAKSIDWR